MTIFYVGGQGKLHWTRNFFVELADLKTSAKGLTNTVDTFEQLFDKDMAQESATEPNRYSEQFKNSRGNILSKLSRVNEWQPVTAEVVYIVLTLFVLMGTVQKPSVRRYFSRNQVAATPVAGSVIALDRYEIIRRFQHFINTSMTHLKDNKICSKYIYN